MYENGKMTHVKTISGLGQREIKDNERRGVFNYDIL
jgi:hypothetical protein